MESFRGLREFPSFRKETSCDSCIIIKEAMVLFDRSSANLEGYLPETACMQCLAISKLTSVQSSHPHTLLLVAHE